MYKESFTSNKVAVDDLLQFPKLSNKERSISEIKMLLEFNESDDLVWEQ